MTKTDEKLDREEIRRAMEALNQEVRENWHDLQWRAAMAAEIAETIYEGFEHENLLELLTDLEFAGEFDRVFVSEVRGLRAFWIALGGDIESSTLRKDTIEVQRDNLTFRVDEFEDKLLSNFAETQANLIDLGIQRMQAELNSRLLRTLQAAIPSGSDQYISGNGLSLTALNAAIREVQDESRTDEIAIVGRSTMIGQVYDQVADGAGFFPETNEEYLRRGSVATYRGARLVRLTNFKDDADVSFFPANELFVIGRDASKFVIWGGLKSQEGTDKDWRWMYQARQQAGVLVHRPERARRIVDTAILP